MHISLAISMKRVARSRVYSVWKNEIFQDKGKLKLWEGRRAAILEAFWNKKR